jgi:membrane protein DedA with SNARE-associated domain
MDVLSPLWIQDLLSTYGLLVLFAVVMLESMAVPVPGETALISAALYAGATGAFGIAPVILVAAAGAIVGDNFGYLIGRTVGLPLLARYGRYVRLDEARLRVGQYLFRRHGGKIVFFGRFVAFLRAFAALLAGANRMRWPHFLAMNALGGISWATLFGAGAYLIGTRIKSVAAPLGVVLLMAAAALVVAGTIFFRRHESELVARARKALPGPLTGPRHARPGDPLG